MDRASIQTIPGRASTSIASIPISTSPKTHEIVLGVDREIMQQPRGERRVHVAAFQRRHLDRHRSRRPGNTVYPLVGVTSADYVQEGVVAGSAPGIGNYSQPIYAPIESALPPGNGGEYRNRPGYHQRYLGFEVQATKRLADRWMARVGFSTEHAHRDTSTIRRWRCRTRRRPPSSRTSMAASS